MMAGQKGGKHMNKLEEMRRKAGLTQLELSKKSGVAQGTISRLEVVGLNDAKVKTLLELADAIGCEIGYFF
jgi:transcriptional regulator with XRE-family HTH domain